MNYFIFIFLLVISIKSQAQSDSGKFIFKYVDQMPSPGFDLPAYIAKNLNCPDNMKNQEIKGSFKVKFVVDESGTITDVTLINGNNGYCEHEVIRMVQNMPRWVPGKKNGKHVKVWFTLPIGCIKFE